MPKTYYLTTPIYYVNGKPHIGHAYTTILADALARLRRFLGEEAFFLTGTDEHGEKIEKTAAAQGVPIIEFVNGNVQAFKDLWQNLGIQYDFFIRTTDPIHQKYVQDTLGRLYKAGEIYKGKYVGWYSVRSETFYSESELVEGKCPDTGGDVHKIEEENYFFKLSKYQSWLIDYIKTHPGFIRPDSRCREVLGFLENHKLEDLCISRPKSRMSWGIEIPFDTNYVVYVWFDALLNYTSILDYSLKSTEAKKLWPADVQLIGKDILRHHAVYWPIMLKAMGLELPKTLFAHGWWVMGGEKMSKSLGNVVDPIQLAEKYSSDALRYYLLKEVVLGFDGCFSEELFSNRFRELANDLGNLVHRSFSMLEKYFDGIAQAPTADYSYLLKGHCDQLIQSLKAQAENFDLKGILEDLWAIVIAANRSVETRQPWKLAKDPSQKAFLGSFLYELLETCRFIGAVLAPFMPNTSRKILEMFQESGLPTFQSSAFFGKLKPGTLLKKGEPLFPKLEEE